MRTLNRHIVFSYIGPFLMTFFIAVFVLFMQFLWKYVDDIIGKGLETQTILELFFYASLTTFPLALPLAILLSSLMTFGNLGEQFELVAMKSSGMSLWKIMRPLILVASITSVGAFVFSNNTLPLVNLKMKNLLYDIQQKKPALNIREGVFYNGIDRYTIRLEKKESDGINCKGIMIYDHTQGLGNNRVTLADSGKLQVTTNKRYLSVILFSGTNYEEIADKANDTTHSFVRSKFKEQKVLFDLSGFRMERTQEDLFKTNYAMLNISQINYITDSIEKNKKEQISLFKKNFSSMMAISEKPETKTSSATPKKNISQVSNTTQLTNQPRAEKTQVIDFALNIARSKKYYIESLSSDLESINNPLIPLSIEWHKKFSLSLSCLILFFIGAPLGAIIRKGGLGMPVVVSVIIFILFWVINITGEKMSQEGALQPYTGMWIASAITLPIGIFLTSKANADSVIFDTTAYLNFFKKLLPNKK
jgi:lipopolysaccharide export system permease protein